MEDQLVGVKELEALFGPPASWWYSAAETKRVPSYKIGKYVRFKVPEIKKWVDEQRQGPRIEATR